MDSRAPPVLVFVTMLRRLAPSLLDPRVLLLAAAAVVGVTVATAVLVARRGWRVDPVEALRSE